MEYVVPLILAIIGIGLNSHFSPTARKIYLLVILTYMVILMGMRYRVGMDTIGYMKSFKDTLPLDKVFSMNVFSQRHEPGYLLLCAICKMFSNEFWPVQLAMNLITTGGIFIFLYRNCRNVFMGVVLFIILQWLYFSTEIMRESAAIGIFMVNYRNLKEQRWLRYYLLSLLSISFHYSSLLIWFFPFVKYLRANLWFFLLCIGILGVTPLVEEFNKMLALGIISEKISFYVKDVNSVNMNWRISEMIKTGFPAILTLLLYRFSHLKCQMQPFLLLQVIFCCGAFAIPVIFQRFTNYTTLFITVSLANYLMVRYVNPVLKTVVIGLICLSQSIFYASLYPAWYPYVSINNPITIQQRENLYRKIWR